MHKKEKKITKRSPNILLSLLVCFCFIAFLASCESGDKKTESKDALIDSTTKSVDVTDESETVTDEQIKADSVLAASVRAENSTWVMKLSKANLELILKTGNPTESDLARQLFFEPIQINGRWGLRVKSKNRGGSDESNFVNLEILDTIESVPNVNLLKRVKQRVNRGELRAIFGVGAGTTPIQATNITDLYFKAAISAHSKAPGKMVYYYSRNLSLLLSASLVDPAITNPSPPKGDCESGCDDPPQP